MMCHCKPFKHPGHLFGLNSFASSLLLGGSGLKHICYVICWSFHVLSYQCVNFNRHLLLSETWEGNSEKVWLSILGLESTIFGPCPK